MYNIVLGEFRSRDAAEMALTALGPAVRPPNTASLVERAPNPKPGQVGFKPSATHEGLLKGGVLGLILGLAVGLTLIGPLGLFPTMGFAIVIIMALGTTFFGGLAGFLTGANSPERRLRKLRAELPPEHVLVMIEMSDGNPNRMARQLRARGALDTHIAKHGREWLVERMS